MKKIERGFMLEGSRYFFDGGQCASSRGWAQVDTGQDASYYGTWANPFEFKTICYCEGDIITVTLDTAAEFVTEIWAMKLWNEKQGWNFYGIDPGFNQELTAQFESLGLGSMLH